MSDRLPPIPTPTAQHWRQVRLQYVPVVVFAIAVIAAVILWTQWVAPPTLVGEAEAVRTEVRSAQPGALSGLAVELLQPVKAGQVLGQIQVHPPGVLEASVATLRAEIEMLRVTMDPVVSQQRTTLDTQRLQLDWMSKRVEYAALQGDLMQAESTLARSNKLHAAKMITDDEFEIARNNRDTLRAQVKAQAELIASLEPVMKSTVDTILPSPTEGLAAAIRHKEQELRLMEAQYRPVPLTAPIDGVITMIYRRSGEAVGSAEPILQISATHSERIIGFLRPPLNVEPKLGMEVEVRTRTFRRQAGTGRVAHIGEQLEPVSPTLLAALKVPITPSTLATELGIRVHVTLPSGLALRPGEQVDLILRQ